MKILKIALSTLTALLLLAPLTFAGGSSLLVKQLSHTGRHLTTGETNQIILKFSVQPWELIENDVKIIDLDIGCTPGHGFSNFQLYNYEELIDTADLLDKYEENDKGMVAHFYESDFEFPNNVQTDLTVRVDVEEDSKDQIVACAIDNIIFENVENGDIYGAMEQGNILDGIDHVIYVDDPNDKRFEDFEINETDLGVDLPMTTEENLVFQFDIETTSDEEAYIQDVFLYCNNVSEIQNGYLQLEDTSEIAPEKIERDGLLTDRPEHTNQKRFIFTDLNIDIRGNPSFSLYANTYNYFHNDRLTECEVLDVMVEYPKPEPFIDVSEYHENAEAIYYLRDHGYVQGYGDGTFKPSNDITRAELLKILMEGAGLRPDVTIFNNCFPDVGTDWYAPYVCFAKSRGWVEGYGDGNFMPGSLVKDVESIKMTLETQFIEVDELTNGTGEWYEPYVKKGIEVGAVLPFETTGYMLKRRQVSQNLYNTLMWEKDNPQQKIKLFNFLSFIYGPEYNISGGVDCGDYCSITIRKNDDTNNIMSIMQTSFSEMQESLNEENADPISAFATSGKMIPIDILRGQIMAVFEYNEYYFEDFVGEEDMWIIYFYVKSASGGDQGYGISIVYDNEEFKNEMLEIVKTLAVE